MGEGEKRKYERLKADFALSCCRVGQDDSHVYTGRTVNVCPGGLYFRTEVTSFKPGNILRVELTIPPKSGLLETGGRIAATGKVLRIQPIHSQNSTAHGVAVEFCGCPKYLF